MAKNKTPERLRDTIMKIVLYLTAVGFVTAGSVVFFVEDLKETVYDGLLILVWGVLMVDLALSFILGVKYVQGILENLTVVDSIVLLFSDNKKVAVFILRFVSSPILLIFGLWLIYKSLLFFFL